MNAGETFQAALAHLRSGRADEAGALLRGMLAAQPGHPELLHMSGLAALQAGRADEAADFIRRALHANPEEPSYHSNLGVALTALDRCEEATACLRHAIALRPGFAHAHYNLGKTFRAQGALDDALSAYSEAARLDPGLAQAHNNIGTLLHDRREIDGAATAYRRAIQCWPDFAEAHGNLANALKDQGRVEEAIPEYRRAIALQPGNAAIGSNLIHALQYSAERNGAELADELRAWNARHAAPFRSAWTARSHAPDPQRRLRVGYVSADFRNHAVGRTFIGNYEAHDRGNFEIVCYSAQGSDDGLTARFRRGADVWRDVAALSDDALDVQIRSDKIDILVDMSLHTAGNRLPVFARKPAPVQMTWLGYPGTTGLEAMDWRITDRFLEPLGQDIVRGTEQPLRLPDAWCCYGAHPASPDVAPLPAAQSGQVTFGSINNIAKVNARCLALWAEILRRTGGSRLLMLCTEDRRPDVTRFFAERGIGPDRIGYLGYYPTPTPGGVQADGHLRRCAQIDIALDPFPYNGLTTTCDAMWMGVPVVALIGELPLARLSYSVLSNVGLPELAAATEEDYIRIAAALAHDLPRLTALRATLRGKMKASPLLDAARFTRILESAYRTAWKKWCAS